MPCLLFSPPNVECGDSSPPSEPCGDECRSPDGAACGAIREDADHKTRITPQAASSGLRTDCCVRRGRHCQDVGFRPENGIRRTRLARWFAGAVRIQRPRHGVGGVGWDVVGEKFMSWKILK